MALPQVARTTPNFEIVDPLSDPRWDAWVAEQRDAAVFHTSAWARVLVETYGFAPHYARDGAHGTLLPLVEVDSWITGRRGISLPFSDLCPPIGPQAPTLDAGFFARLTAHARNRRWKYLELRGAAPTAEGVQSALSYYTHELDLSVGEPALFGQFHQAVRRAIRKAEKSELTTEIVTTPGAIEEYFRLHELTRRRHGLPPQPIKFFQAIQRHVLARGLGFAVLVRRHGRVIAGVIFFHMGTGAMFKFGASDERFQEYRPTNLVLWTAIKHCISLGVHHLHFGRNALCHESLRRFKQSWGTVESQVHYTKFVCATSTFVPSHSLLDGWQNHVFRRLPLPVSRMIGRYLYRHIA